MGSLMGALVSPVAAKSHLREVIEKLHNLTVYPNNMPFITTGVIQPGIFDVNVTGRVAPVVNLIGDRMSMEYFPGISPSPAPTTSLVQVAYDLRYYAEQGNVVATVIDTVYKKLAVPGDLSTPIGDPIPLTQFGFWKFNKNKVIEQYDLAVPDLGKWNIEVGADYTNPAIQSVLNQVTCARYMANCNSTVDPLGYYTSFSDCTTFLGSIRYGTPDYSWDDTAYCRLVHSGMVLANPVVHCPHAGKTGGGACVDNPYSSYYSFQFPSSFDADALKGND
jgi:hypothetical protein